MMRRMNDMNIFKLTQTTEHVLEICMSLKQKNDLLREKQQKLVEKNKIACQKIAQMITLLESIVEKVKS